jgi:hypothetical protein
VLKQRCAWSTAAARTSARWLAPDLTSPPPSLGMTLWPPEASAPEARAPEAPAPKRSGASIVWLGSCAQPAAGLPSPALCAGVGVVGWGGATGASQGAAASRQLGISTADGRCRSCTLHQPGCMLLGCPATAHARACLKSLGKGGKCPVNSKPRHSSQWASSIARPDAATPSAGRWRPNWVLQRVCERKAKPFSEFASAVQSTEWPYVFH